MDYELLNARFVQPFVETVNLNVNLNLENIRRGAVIQEDDFPTPVTEIFFLTPYIIKEWVEIYVNGLRLVNASYDFGETHEDYEIIGDRIVFARPQSGNIKIVIEREATGPFLPPENIIPIRNEQGARTRATRPGDLFVSYFCTPIVLSEPLNGFVRVTDDGLNLAYCPDPDFQGFDAFSYTVISERGQIAEPKCAYIKVGNPTVETP
jgi:hypothetical protein